MRRTAAPTVRRALGLMPSRPRDNAGLASGVGVRPGRLGEGVQPSRDTTDKRWLLGRRGQPAGACAGADRGDPALRPTRCATLAGVGCCRGPSVGRQRVGSACRRGRCQHRLRPKLTRQGISAGDVHAAGTTADAQLYRDVLRSCWMTSESMAGKPLGPIAGRPLVASAASC